MNIISTAHFLARIGKSKNAELKLKKSLILTEDTDDEIKTNGKVIVVQPIYKWLLEGTN